MSEEYFTTLENQNQNQNQFSSNSLQAKQEKQEKFVSLSSSVDANDIAKTIAINCKDFKKNKSKMMIYKQNPNSELDTPYYARFKELEYNPKREYKWKRSLFYDEGKRRSKDDETEIAKVKALFDAETDPDKKKILQDNLDLFKWRDYILKSTESDTGIDREMRDITTDYYPEEIGMSRPWIERHSHIPDYSY